MLELHSPLPPEVLARRHQLPRKPAGLTLTAQRIRLEPLDLERDIRALYAISNGEAITVGSRTQPDYDADALIWRFMADGPFASADELQAHLQAQVEAPDGLPFTVFERTTDHPIGIINYMNNDPGALKIELGSIWYSPIAQRTGANTEATYLLLRHAFALGYRRLEWKCNARNERSRQSALRMGFQFEGVQEYHMIIKGRSRDTAWFRILEHEWPGVKLHLEGLLAGNG
jgi:RimJ/RimL family protein N-acetyltransferase